MVDFDAVFNVQKLQAGPNRSMLNQAVTCDVLNLRIGDAAVVLKEGGQPAAIDVAVLVDCRGQDCTSVLAAPDWVVSAASKKRYAERRTCDDHRSSFHP